MSPYFCNSRNSSGGDGSSSGNSSSSPLEQHYYYLCDYYYHHHLSRYVTSHPGQLSLAILLWVGAISTGQRAVMPCGSGVKAGVARVRVAGKTVIPLLHTGYIGVLRGKMAHNKGRYKLISLPKSLILLLECISLQVSK